MNPFCFPKGFVVVEINSSGLKLWNLSPICVKLWCFCSIASLLACPWGYSRTSVVQQSDKDLGRFYSQIAGFSLSVVTLVSRIPQPTFPLALQALNSFLKYTNSIKLLIFAPQAVYTLGNMFCQRCSKVTNLTRSFSIPLVLPAILMDSAMWPCMWPLNLEVIQGRVCILDLNPFCGYPASRTYPFISICSLWTLPLLPWSGKNAAFHCQICEHGLGAQKKARKPLTPSSYPISRNLLW